MNKKKILALTMSLILMQNIATLATENLQQTTNVVQNSVEDDSSTENKSKKMTLDELNERISSKAYAVMNIQTGDLVLSKNENEKMYPASLTKIMTCLLLVENLKMDDKITISKEAAEIGEASIYLQEGEVLTAKDLFMGMMLQSGNDACYATGEAISGDMDSFYALMNKRAKEIGMTNSNFKSSNGLHHEEHYTTAHDFALLTKVALENPIFKELFQTKKYEFKNRHEKGMKSTTNKNKMMIEGREEYNPQVMGGKTAYTRQAGNCLMEVFKHENSEYAIITLDSETIYPDNELLINYVSENFSYKNVLEKDNIHTFFREQDISLYTDGAVAIANTDENKNLNTKIDIIMDKHIQQEIIQGQEVGVANIYVGDKLYKTKKLYSSKNYVFEKQDSFKFMKNLFVFIVVVLLSKFGLSTFIAHKNKNKNKLKKSDFF